MKLNLRRGFRKGTGSGVQNNIMTTKFTAVDSDSTAGNRMNILEE